MMKRKERKGKRKGKEIRGKWSRKGVAWGWGCERMVRRDGSLYSTPTHSVTPLPDQKRSDRS